MLRAGLFLGDRYEIIEKIGTGGMAEVFKGRDHKLNRDVAIKVLRQEFSEDTNFVSKFRVEAQSAAGLTDKNIISIYDVGEENGLYYIVMELVEGMTLKSFIEGKGRLEIKQVISIALQISMGLETAHKNHIIHRDIKPQNVLLSGEGKVKITDFGIAKAATSNTVSSNVMGSVHYTSPEQARGGYSDEKSDIYSLGITMYEMLTGYPPFDGDTTVSIAVQHIQEEFPDILAARPETPIALEKIILKCTMKRPDCRYANMEELIADLKQCLLTPNEDFVKMVSLGDGKTKVMSKEDVNKIKEQAAKKNVTKEDLVNKNKAKKKNEEEELNPQLEKTLTTLAIIAGVIVLIIATIAIYITFSELIPGKGKTKNEKKVEKPVTSTIPENKVLMINVCGKTQEEAQNALHEMNLGFEVVGSDFSDEYEKGLVMSQTINGVAVNEGEAVEKNSRVELVISKGPAALSVPDVSGKTESEAQSEIESMGLVFKVNDHQYSNSYEAGQVITSEPEAGKEINKGETVGVIISRGAEKVTVPNLYNRTQAEAEAALSEVGLSIGKVEIATQYSESVPEGNVISQNFQSGSSVQKGTEIDIVLSKGVEEVTRVWKGSVRIATADLPDDFESGNVKLELTQTVDNSTVTKTILDNTMSKDEFPYTMQITGATGVTSGDVVLYVDGNKVGSYNVSFSEQ